MSKIIPDWPSNRRSKSALKLAHIDFAKRPLFTTPLASTLTMEKSEGMLVASGATLDEKEEEDEDEDEGEGEGEDEGEEDNEEAVKLGESLRLTMKRR
jgi:hypothetical protein